jgi:tetratricopeptide (TPR) repeat protein
MKYNRLATLALLLHCAGPSFVRAQGAGVEWNILNQEAMTLYRAGKYDRAVVVARKALEVAEQNVGPDHPDVATSLENLAVLYRACKRNAEAEALEQRAAKIRAIHMKERIRLKLEAGLNRKVTISFLGLWGLLTAICFLFGIPDMSSLVKLVWSQSFAIAIGKALLLLVPFGQLYVVLLSGADRVFKIGRVLYVAATIVLVLLLDRKLFAGAFGRWLLDASGRQQLAVASSLIIVLSLFEVRVGDQWYSLLYNQRGNRIASGLLTITSDSSMTGILSISGFAGTVPTKSKPAVPRDGP